MSTTITTLPSINDHIEIGDSDADHSDTDSLASETTSITDSVIDYVYENGRRYPSHRWSSTKLAGSILPNDEIEQQRLDLIHHFYLLVLRGELYLAPLEKGKVRNALDIGTGTGIWAIDFATLHPTCQVTGTDLSPIQPLWLPKNVSFEVDNFEDEWMFRTPFDYIHGRCLMGSVTDWPKLIKRAYNNLTPGGHLELLEIHNTGGYSTDATYEGSACERYTNALNEAGKLSGHRLDLAPSLASYFEEAGFVNVVVKKFKVAVGVWPKDPYYKRMGAILASQAGEGAEAYGLQLMTKVLGWSEEEAKRVCGEAAEGWRGRRVHMVNDQYVVYGQRPVEG
ncbi:S-adenosyl-L-methionine-dependent methyltransferase [Ascobolus immersus RN42]|uniref:S-adenosyl-L-methionine-dependent methyltransferase n=1 Tax=Ascobolus immersus RN42 TaxID=1160509 RepID=A0A3N4HHP7_ASCIM|nr:S-adenosyl-L-methionine-dependent methyltransferase [Ascobolus immersus RN42]